MEDPCLDLDEVDEELSDLEADTHAVEDRGAREEPQGGDQCVRKGPRNLCEKTESSSIRSVKRKVRNIFNKKCQVIECLNPMRISRGTMK